MTAGRASWHPRIRCKKKKKRAVSPAWRRAEGGGDERVHAPVSDPRPKSETMRRFIARVGNGRLVTAGCARASMARSPKKVECTNLGGGRDDRKISAARWTQAQGPGKSARSRAGRGRLRGLRTI